MSASVSVCKLYFCIKLDLLSLSTPFTKNLMRLTQVIREIFSESNFEIPSHYSKKSDAKVRVKSHRLSIKLIVR